MGIELTETCDICGAKGTKTSNNQYFDCHYDLVGALQDEEGNFLGYICRDCYKQYKDGKAKAIKAFEAAFFGKKPEPEPEAGKTLKPEPDTTKLLKMAYDRLLEDCKTCDHTKAGNRGGGQCEGCICFEILGPLHLYCATHTAACSTGAGPHCRDCEMESACVEPKK